MKVKSNNIRLQYGSHFEPEIVVSVTQNIQADVEELQAIIAKGKELSVEIKQFRHNRSLDANAYLWVLLSKMAEVLHTTKDELYLLMLERYGVFTHIVVKLNVAERVKQEWRTVRELGEVTINGQTGIQLQCYFGSSTYNTKEMATLIDGVVSECKEIGVETMTPSEVEALTEMGA